MTIILLSVVLVGVGAALFFIKKLDTAVGGVKDCEDTLKNDLFENVPY